MLLNRLEAGLGSQISATCYKPNPAFWLHMGRLRGIAPSADWWHVSAYADYDLDVANALGLTTVLVTRPHMRPGAASHMVADLKALVSLLAAEAA